MVKKVIFYLYGGGFMLGDDISYGVMVVWIVGEVGLCVVMVDYCFVLEYFYFVVIDDV